MRIYSNARQLMSEMGRDLWEMGTIIQPKTYQNKVIDGNPDFITKEEFCKQYCLTSLPDPDFLFIFTDTKEWADKELTERLSGKSLNPGEAYKLNLKMWEPFLSHVNGKLKFDYTYSERLSKIVRSFNSPNEFTTVLDGVIDLLKYDPDTRKAVLPIFNSSDCNHYNGDARIPCSMYYGFFIRNHQLNITYHQRSSDFVGHFGDDVYLAWNLMCYIAKKVDVKPGYLIHTIDSLHVYKKDWWLLKKSVDDYGL